MLIEMQIIKKVMFGVGVSGLAPGFFAHDARVSVQHDVVCESGVRPMSAPPVCQSPAKYHVQAGQVLHVAQCDDRPIQFPTHENFSYQLAPDARGRPALIYDGVKYTLLEKTTVREEGECWIGDARNSVQLSDPAAGTIIDIIHATNKAAYKDITPILHKLKQIKGAMIEQKKENARRAKKGLPPIGGLAGRSGGVVARQVGYAAPPPGYGQQLGYGPVFDPRHSANPPLPIWEQIGGSPAQGFNPYMAC